MAAARVEQPERAAGEVRMQDRPPHREALPLHLRIEHTIEQTLSNKLANIEQTLSKQGANIEQTRSKQGANKEQTRSKQEEQTVSKQ
jgi:hypothetical protein